MKKLLAMAALTACAAPLWATTQTVTLSLPDMNCAACPITVKKALTKVSGVGKIDVNLNRREAKVTFDDVKTSVILESTLTCPECGHAKTETMPTDACQWFYECEQCHAVLKPKPGDCCVYCSYGTVPCPPIQERGKGSCCSG